MKAKNILTIDIGNSNIVIGLVSPEEDLFLERLSTIREKTDAEYAMALSSIFKLHQISFSEIDGSIISSVVPPLTMTLARAIQQISGLTPLIVGPGIKTGLKIRTDNPAQLGSDRVVDAVAAMAEYPLPLIVIDMGTATTISVIDRDGVYQGGTIAPGVRTSMDAMISRSSQLPRIDLEYDSGVIGTNTIDCMKSGMILGNASMIDGMISRIEHELGYPTNVVATGGLAHCIIPHCYHQIRYDEGLLIKGLALLYRKNRS